MKRLIQILFAVVISAALFAACEGPAGAKGEKGDKGDAGKDGKDASLSCTVCHGDNDVNFKFAQYDLSKHNKGIVYEEEAGRISCGGCHSGDGFAEAAAAGKDDPTTKATSKINCMACHPIHTKYDETDFALRIAAPIKLRKTGAEVDFKTGNLCAKCHQARTYPDVAGADTTIPGSAAWTRFGPHYGTPANVFSMKGPYNVAGSMTVPSNNVHANLPKGCVSCHMGSLSTNPAVGGHSFLMTAPQMSEVQDCKGCHSDPTFFTSATAFPKMKENATNLALYRRLLIDKGLLDTSQAITADGYQLLGEYLKTKTKYTKADMEVALNYLYLAKDRSMGAHNPTYVYALIKNGIEYLQK